MQKKTAKRKAKAKKQAPAKVVKKSPAAKKSAAVKKSRKRVSAAPPACKGKPQPAPVILDAGLAATKEGGIRSLPPRQQLFVAEYLANGMNGTQAAIKAGYSAKTAHSQACRMLRNVKVAEAVAGRTAAKMEELDYSVNRTLLTVASLAFFDVAELFNEDGSMRALKDMTPHARNAIMGVETNELYASHDKDGERTSFGQVRKVKLADRRAALDMLMRYHSLYKDKVEHTGKVTLESLILGSDEDD